MLISNFDESSKFFKKLKTPLITTSFNEPHILIGAYDGFNIIRTMDITGYESISPELIDIMRCQGCWLNFGITTKIPLDGIIPQELIPMINGPLDVDNNGVPIYYVDIFRELNNKYEMVKFLMDNGCKRYIDIPLTDTPFFEQLDKMKAIDGAIFWKLEPHICLAMYKGLIPYAKGDIVTVTIYDLKDSFLAEFVTHKKKKEPDIKTYIKYLYV